MMHSFIRALFIATVLQATHCNAFRVKVVLTVKGVMSDDNVDKIAIRGDGLGFVQQTVGAAMPPPSGTGCEAPPVLRVLPVPSRRDPYKNFHSATSRRQMDPTGKCLIAGKCNFGVSSELNPFVGKILNVAQDGCDLVTSPVCRVFQIRMFSVNIVEGASPAPTDGSAFLCPYYCPASHAVCVGTTRVCDATSPCGRHLFDETLSTHAFQQQQHSSKSDDGVTRREELGVLSSSDSVSEYMWSGPPLSIESGGTSSSTAAESIVRSSIEAQLSKPSVRSQLQQAFEALGGEGSLSTFAATVRIAPFEDASSCDAFVSGLTPELINVTGLSGECSALAGKCNSVLDEFQTGLVSQCSCDWNCSSVTLSAEGERYYTMHDRCAAAVGRLCP